MKISTRLTLGFGMAILLSLAITVYAIVQMRSLAADLDELANDRMDKAHAFSSVMDNLNAAGIHARNIVMNPTRPTASPKP